MAANTEFDFLVAIVSKASEGGGEEPDDHIVDGNRQRSVSAYVTTGSHQHFLCICCSQNTHEYVMTAWRSAAILTTLYSSSHGFPWNRNTLEEDSEEEDVCPRVTQGKEQSVVSNLHHNEAYSCGRKLLMWRRR